MDCPSKIAFDHDTLLVTGLRSGQYIVELSFVCCLQLLVTHTMEDPWTDMIFCVHEIIGIDHKCVKIKGLVSH